MNRAAVPPMLLTALLVLTTTGLSAQRDSLLRRHPDSTRRATALDAITVTVTRGRTSLRTSPANVTVLTGDAIAKSPAVSVPGILQTIPGFALGNHSHPLTQRPERTSGVFRGLGGTSASRALVLLDGVPVNDPFNGWVRWSRVPLSLVERIEVVRGGGSMSWGSRALSGVINLITTTAEATRVEATVEGGGLATTRAAVSASVRQGQFDLLVAGDILDTDGFLLIREDQAGAVDLPRGVQTRVGYAKARYRFRPNLNVHIGANYLDDRNRGETPLTARTATTAEIRGGLDWALPNGGVMTLLAYRQTRDAAFTLPAVSTDRATEGPRRATRIPSTGAGGTVQWARRVAGRHDVSVGVDASWVDGEYRDQHTVVAGQLTRERSSGGTQSSIGLFVQDGITLGDHTNLQAGARVDRIRDEDGRRGEIVLATGASLSDSTYPGRSVTPLTFNVGVTHALSDVVRLRTSGYRAFRNATLNELHTPLYTGTFGSNVVEANADLAAETLLGAELCADLEPGDAWLVRLTGFWNRVSDPIVEFTVGTATANGEVIEPCGPLNRNGVCRQRRNVGVLRSVGVESEVDWRPSARFGLGMAYAFNPTRIISPGEAVDGASPRGAARHAITGTARWSAPHLVDIGIEVRHVGTRYDDDRNTIALEPFTIIGAHLSRRVTRQLTAYLRVENLLDTEYEISRGTSGLVEVGGPRWILAGLRGRW